MSLIYLILPENVVEKIFSDQIAEINAIRGQIIFFDNFQKIIVNNIGVLFLSFVFSFLFGAGAVFILAWNASVLAAAIGITAKTFGSAVVGLPVAILVFLPHGILEILAYFIGAVAGGLISTVIMRKNSKKFWFVISDGLQLMLVAAVLLVVAAIVESAAIVL